MTTSIRLPLLLIRLWRLSSLPHPSLRRAATHAAATLFPLIPPLPPLSSPGTLSPSLSSPPHPAARHTATFDINSANPRPLIRLAIPTNSCAEDHGSHASLQGIRDKHFLVWLRTTRPCQLNLPCSSAPQLLTTPLLFRPTLLQPLPPV